jgi:ABC-type glycerol-3-phosphate transport system substrate-binding protein
MKLKKLIPIVVVALVLPLAACSSSNGSSGGSTTAKSTVNWWTWDDKQAAAYQLCVPGFEKANPNITVKITQYNVNDYFTKLTAGFVAGTAPDAFQNSVPILGEYASQKQIMPLDDLIKKSGFDLGKYNIGVSSWKYTDGKQYGLPLDWASSAFYFNKDDLKKAGISEDQTANMTWNPYNGGTFDKIVAHLTVDKNGVRGDEPGFDKNNVAVYGVGSLAAPDFNGQTSWNSFASSAGWQMGNKKAWPTKLNFDSPTFVKTVDYVRSLEARGFAPKYGSFTMADTEQLGSGKVAMIEGGSWEATTFAKLPGMSIGIAPTVKGSNGRSVISNSNANNIWVGTKNVDSTWKWVTYMGTQTCQSLAGASGSFFPSISASMVSVVNAQAKQGVDLSVFENQLKNKELNASPPMANGQKLTDTIQPMFESFFSGETSDAIFKQATTQSGQILTGK